MFIFIMAIFSFVCGALCVYFAVEVRKMRLYALEQKLEEQAAYNREIDNALKVKARKLKSDQEVYAAELIKFMTMKKEFDSRHVSYEELQAENKLLKEDLRKCAIVTAKQAYEQSESDRLREAQCKMSNELGVAYLKDTQRWIIKSLNQNNYAACKQRLLNAIAKVREIGVTVTDAEEKQRLTELQKEYEIVVRAAMEREEQARIRALIREEQQRERELQKIREEAERAKREKLRIEEAIEKANREAAGKLTYEIQRLKEQLEVANQALEDSQRAISMAQLTKAGNVYVISNIGSFGEGVFKIGMTRRLDPLDRIRELGDASVPFPFDIHMMIATEDAPNLEKALHQAFHKTRLNKTNPRKEFFRTSIDEILKVVKDNHGEVEYQADAQALQYRQSLEMSDEDTEFIEQVYAKEAKMHPEMQADED